MSGIKPVSLILSELFCFYLAHSNCNYPSVQRLHIIGVIRLTQISISGSINTFIYIQPVYCIRGLYNKYFVQVFLSKSSTGIHK